MIAPRLATAVIALAIACGLGPAAETPPAAPPEPEGSLTLADALAAALARNPDLEVASWEVQASAARELTASAVPNPELALRLYRYGEERGPEDEDSGQRVMVNHTLELGGKWQRRIDLARAERAVVEQDERSAQRELVALVTSRFVAVLGAQQASRAWRDLVEFEEHMLGSVRALVENGSLRGVEVHRAARQLGLARLELQQAEGELGSARSAIAATWGGLAPRFTEAVGDLAPTAPVPSLDEVAALAATSPAVRSAEAEVGRGQAAVELARASRVPDLGFGLGMRWDDIDQRDYLFDLELELPVFDRKRGEIEEARSELARAQAAQRSTAAAHAATVSGLYHELVEADRRRATIAEEILPAARAAFEAFRLGFANESETLEDLLDARQELAEAEADYARALVDRYGAQAALDGALGRDGG